MTSILKNIFVFPLKAGNSRPTRLEYKDGSISSTVMLASIISVSFVLIIIFTSLKPDKNINPSPVLWVLTFIVNIAGIVFLVLLSITGYRRRDEQPSGEHLAVDWSSGRKLVFLWIFGFGTIIHSFMNATINIDCLRKSGQESFQGEFIVGILSHFLAIVFYTLLIGFISYFSMYRFISSKLVNYGMLSILAASIVQWFRTALSEFSMTANTNGTSFNNNSINFNSCYWNSDLQHLFRTSYPYIIPAQIECGLLTAAFILGMWTTATTGAHGTENRLTDSLTEVSALLDSSSNSDYQSVTRARRESVVHSLSHYVSMVVGVTLSVPFLTCVCIYIYVMKDNISVFYAWEVVEAIYKIALLLVILAAFQALTTQCYEHTNALGIQSSEGILIFSMAGMVGFNCFGIVAGSMTGNDVGKNRPVIWVILENGMTILSSFLQTVLIIQAERYQRLRQNNRSCTKVEDLFLLLHIMNFTLWLFDSITANSIIVTTKVQDEFFEHGSWLLITHIVFPISVFYRFHSMIHCYGLSKKLQA